MDALTMVKWVKESWDEIHTEIIPKFPKMLYQQCYGHLGRFFPDSNEPSFTSMELKSEDMYNVDGEDILDFER